MRGSRTVLRNVLNQSIVLLVVASLPQRTLAGVDPFAGIAAVKDEQLDDLRGGFENSQGLQFSFAIERAIVVNGELVSMTRIILNDLSPLLAGGVPSAEVIASARSIVQSGLGNTVVPLTGATPATLPAIPVTTPAPGTATSTAAGASTVASASPVSPATPSTMPAATTPAIANAATTPATTTATSPATATATVGPGSTTPATSNAATTAAAGTGATGTGPTPSTAAVSAASPPASAPPSAAATSSSAPSVATTSAAAPSAQATNTTPGTLYIQMNAGGQTILIPNASAIVTAVQNTVNNQIIQARTTIDATLNSLSALRSSTFSESLRLQALDGIRR